MSCRLLLVDDHALIRAGVRAMIHDLPDYEIVGEAQNAQHAITLAEELQPNIILLDVSLDGTSGIDALQDLQSVAPDSRVLMLSMHSQAQVVLAALGAGAHGYLLKDAAISELHMALNAIDRGERYLSSAIAQPVIAQALSRTQASHEHALTQRQIEILRLISRGVSTRAIAEGLELSVKTVEAHRAQIMKRLQINDLPSLVIYAVRAGIIHLDD
ncbi:response regulator transcription factor [Pseudomonas sp. EA_35y_Pfl2_R5]|uniref:response regulator transcription factor n=1 Tax=Pseudomonas sp. EA_35y_Pfl2_R5 TaxID=3088690 RepID=UPI0030DACDC6